MALVRFSVIFMGALILNLFPRCSTFLQYDECSPLIVVEPLIMSELEFLESSSSSVFEKIIVARTLATWHAADGSVAV